jgi:hypothetical protein
MAEPSEETDTPPISLPGEVYVQVGSTACTGGMMERMKKMMRTMIIGEVFPEYM